MVEFQAFDLGQVISKYNLNAWNRQAPTEMSDLLRKYHSMLNSPSIRCKENYIHYSYQLNVARPQYISAGKFYIIMSDILLTFKLEKSLAEQMGHFGGPHRDRGDSVVGLSCALVLSDIPSHWEPGRLHLLGQIGRAHV